ncbi:hypothetical protein ABIC65_001480 [Sphingomonas trueperi]|uniref:hypothetical protein n=1 Tax=Sphingomonas trueperi TaxID=53317 RepID=UPI00339328EF
MRSVVLPQARRAVVPLRPQAFGQPPPATLQSSWPHQQKALVVPAKQGALCLMATSSCLLYMFVARWKEAIFIQTDDGNVVLLD